MMTPHPFLPSLRPRAALVGSVGSVVVGARGAKKSPRLFPLLPPKLQYQDLSDILTLTAKEGIELHTPLDLELCLGDDHWPGMSLYKGRELTDHKRYSEI